MSSTFVSLREWLAPVTEPEPLDAQSIDALVPEVESHREPNIETDGDELLSDVRLFRARLEEALDRHVAVLVRDVAVEVLARELELSPVDIAGIAKRARERYSLEEPLVIRAHPDEVSMLADATRVVPDRSLRAGDVILEVPGGAVDATLGMRLERVLRGLAR